MTDIRRLPPGFTPAAQVPAVEYDKIPHSGVVARYIKSRKVHGKDGNEYVLHVFVSQRKGRRFALWGCASLDAQLDNVVPGTVVFILYNGKETMPNGREAHSFQIGIKSDRIDEDTGEVFEDDDSDTVPF